MTLSGEGPAGIVDGDCPSGSREWMRSIGSRAPVAEAAILALVLAHAVAFMTLTGALFEDTGMATSVAAACDSIRAGTTDARWASGSSYYPPLYWLWMTACPWGGRPLDPALLMLWSNIGLGLAALTLCAALRARGLSRSSVRPELVEGSGEGSARTDFGLSRSASAAFLVILLCLPQLNAFLHRPHRECALLALTMLTLAVLVRARDGLPGRAGSLLLGLTIGGGLLSKWTYPIYVAGPLIFSAAICWKRTGGARQPLSRLVMASVAAALVAGPWYASNLDLANLLRTTANDPVHVGEAAGASAYLARVAYYLRTAGSALGPHLSVPICIATIAGLLFRSRLAVLALLSPLPAILVLGLFVHLEDRYLLAALPGLALAAAAGLDALPRRARRLALAAVAGLGLGGVAELTWGGAPGWYPAPAPGVVMVNDAGFRLYWVPLRNSRLLYERLRYWTDRLPVSGAARTFALHPLEPHPDLRSSGIEIPAEDRSGAPGAPRMVGYRSTAYESFVLDQRSRPPDLLLVSRRLFHQPAPGARDLASRVLAFVETDSSGRKDRLEQVPSDPILAAELGRTYGIAETIHLPLGDVWVLIRKSAWKEARAAGGLAPLPASAEVCPEPYPRQCIPAVLR